MALHLTHAMLAQAYELLRATPPFRGWKLPPAEEVEFHVTASVADHADYCNLQDGRHRIRVSYKRHKTLRSLIETMAHEMIHMRERQLKLRWDVAHGATFQRLADRICALHGFDRGSF